GKRELSWTGDSKGAHVLAGFAGIGAGYKKVRNLYGSASRSCPPRRGHRAVRRSRRDRTVTRASPRCHGRVLEIPRGATGFAWHFGSGIAISGSACPCYL